MCVRSPAPAPGRPHVWLIDRWAPWTQDLAASDRPTADELAKASRLVDPAHAQAYRQGRALLRRVLGLYLDCPPADVSVIVLPGGKPVCARGGAIAALGFSVSHTATHWAIALSADGAVGIDIEGQDRAKAAETATRRFTLRARGGGDALRQWTALEAITKCHGAGLRLADGSFDAAGALMQARADSRLAGFTSEGAGHGIVGSVASAGAITALVAPPFGHARAPAGRAAPDKPSGDHRGKCSTWVSAVRPK